MLLTAWINSGFACGTACSAAWFMLATSSSASLPRPIIRMPVASCSSARGSSILTFGLFENPPGTPSLPTADDAPCASAPRMPLEASWFVRSLSPSAHAEPASRQPSTAAVTIDCRMDMVMARIPSFLVLRPAKIADTPVISSSDLAHPNSAHPNDPAVLRRARAGACLPRQQRRLFCDGQGPNGGQRLAAAKLLPPTQVHGHTGRDLAPCTHTPL